MISTINSQELSDAVMQKTNNPLLDRVVSVIDAERDVLALLSDHLNGDGWDVMSEALIALNKTKGRIVISGMGKSGHIGKKIAATMSSLGAPSFFIHPGEASHGDLGMITDRDALIVLSNSGNTAEIKDIVLFAETIEIPIIAITMGRASFLSKKATHTLYIPKTPEGCSLGLAPTTSTTAQLAIGDALSVGLSVMRDFDRDGFNRYHPGGSLGQSTTPVVDVMLTGDDLPLVEEDSEAHNVILEMARKSSDLAGVIDENNHLVGIVYASELSNFTATSAKELMRMPQPVIDPQESLAVARKRAAVRGLKNIFVVENKKPVGILKNL